MNIHLSAQWRTPTPSPQYKSADSSHLGQLLHLVSNAFEERTLAKCRQRGHRKFRSSHSSVIAQLDSKGLCLGDLAERIGISQQATGKVVRDLERAGYIHSHLDIRDKRSRIIQLTDAGLQLQYDIAEVVDEIRAEFIHILSDSGLQSFERQLRDAANVLIQDEVL